MERKGLFYYNSVWIMFCCRNMSNMFIRIRLVIMLLCGKCGIISVLWSLLLIWLFRLPHYFMFFCFHFFIILYMVVCFIWFVYFVNYVLLLLCLCILIVMYVLLSIFCCHVPTGTLRLPWLRFFRAFSSVVREMPGYNSQRRGTAWTLCS